MIWIFHRLYQTQNVPGEEKAPPGATFAPEMLIIAKSEPAAVSWTDFLKKKFYSKLNVDIWSEIDFFRE